MSNCRHYNRRDLIAAEWCSDCGSVRQMVCGKFEAWIEPVARKNTDFDLPECDPHYGAARYYCYRVENEAGNFYLGSRLCFGSPAKDTKYFGSGRWPKWCRKQKVALKKVILSEHQTLTLAVLREARLIMASKANPLCMNGWKPKA